ncbi:MAG: hypothetical protein K5770_19810 [Lachnospiraceae bacterium]|nr:hypothetical protein [Lachnospiraceae bacterium]
MKNLRSAAGFIILSVLTCILAVGFTFRADAYEGKKNTNEQFHIVYDHPEASEFLNRWRSAFAERDAEKLEEMISEKASVSIRSDDFGWNSQAGVFGWSSPWPKDSRILEFGDGKATILYYAFISDPHVSVWREEIEYNIEFTEMDEVLFSVEKEELEMFEEISDLDSFLRAYPDGRIRNTGIDYYGNGDLLMALSDAAYAHAGDKTDDFPYYKSLYSPDSAAVSLLNLSTDPKLVAVSSEVDKKTQETYVKIRFVKEKNEITVKMKQAYGEQGIWLPQDVKGEDKKDPADGVSDEDAYAEVLKNYQEADQKKWSIMECLQKGISPLVTQAGAESLKYSCMDLNDDGLNELLIFDNGKNATDPYYMYALYTREGTRIIPVAVCAHFSFDAGIHLLDHGLINNHSYGTGYYQDAYSYLDGYNDHILSPVMIITMDCSDYSKVEDPDECWYLSTGRETVFCGPIWDDMKEEFTHIKKEDADRIAETFRFKGESDKKDIVSK